MALHLPAAVPRESCFPREPLHLSCCQGISGELSTYLEFYKSPCTLGQRRVVKHREEGLVLLSPGSEGSALARPSRHRQAAGDRVLLLQWRCNIRLITSSGVHRGHRAKLGQILTLPCGKSNIKPQPCCLWKVSVSIPFKGGVFPSPLSWSPFWYRLLLIRERLSREVPGQGWTVPDRFGCGDTPIPSLDCPTP